MKYLSFDIEATGLRKDDLMIEFACVPICSEERSIEKQLSFHRYIQCPSFEDLKASLDPWVQKNNQKLIETAHQTGVSLEQFKNDWQSYLESKQVKSFFSSQKIVLFGKSMNAIDLPFLNRDLGWDWMRKYFSHRVLDFSSVCYAWIDAKQLPAGSESGSQLMATLKMGEVAHTALEDAINTAQMYFACLDFIKTSQ